MIHVGDTCTPVDPGTLPDRLAAAGFTRIIVEASRRMVRFVAFAPGAEGEPSYGPA